MWRRSLASPAHAAAKEQPGSAKPTAALVRISGSAASLTAETLLSADC